MAPPARVLGIDLAAKAKRTCACRLEASGAGLTAELFAGCDDETLRELGERCGKIAIDAPFGWPSPFIDALNEYRQTGSWPRDRRDWGPFRDSLTMRATDHVVSHGRPLSVATDKLGITAMRCAGLLQDWSGTTPIDRTGAGRFVEVYPAAALLRWGLSADGYRGSLHQTTRERLLEQILAALPGLEVDDAARRLCVKSDDAFDALIAALAGRAATLGLTDGPPRGSGEVAVEEGWIHLPLRGSLPFLALERADLSPRPSAALAASARALGARLDARGYVSTFDQALLPSFGKPTRAAIRRDLTGKGGSELLGRKGSRPRFQAAHSSAALSANTFGPFLERETSIPFGGTEFRGTAALERKCPTGLGGIPPTLDFLIESDDVLAIELKCTETFVAHEAVFRESYRSLASRMYPSWRREYEALAEDPRRYRFLDAAQLIKHYLGIKRAFEGRAVVFGYLYWEPLDGLHLPPCAVHRAELAEFSRRLADPRVRFQPLSCEQLWDEWSSDPRLSDHAAALRERYGVSIRGPSAAQR
jgi:Protein of unknown function (DUF429)